MKVLQIIDSLEAGGAERMSVNIANLLVQKGHESILVVTRGSGNMVKYLDSRVVVFFLDKRHFMDVVAFKKLYVIVRDHLPDVMHAHATSSYWAAGIKLARRGKFNLLWHDHYGDSEHLQMRDAKILKMISSSFNGIIAVNEGLKSWAEKTLSFQKDRVVFLRNFPMLPPCDSQKNSIFTIVQVANLRPQKDHHSALKSFRLIKDSGMHFKVYWAGNLTDKDYVDELQKSIYSLDLQDNVEILGEVSFVGEFLQKSHMGLLTSRSEGLPVALLEYGSAGLPVVCTDVGQCAEVIKSPEFGILVPPNDPQKIANGILHFMHNQTASKKIGENLKNVVKQEFGSEAFYGDYMRFIRTFTD